MTNVKELTDVELNRAIIWLYPPKQTLVEDNGIHTGFVGVKGVGYLQDWNITMPLAVENGLRVGFYTDGVTTAFDPDRRTSYSENKNPLRAICEVLVMIKLEKM